MIELPEDTVGAFVDPPAFLAPGVAGGPLDGCRLAVKDLFDVVATVTGAGNPAFAETRTPATRNASAVQRLVDAGASVVGKTITDELAWSLAGTNVHYGMPRNVAAPGRVPGGSSAGSAAAVAAGLADLALGTDTGGSVRIPASYCGIFGWRPTHGCVPSDGVVPLAPSFDVVGLFAQRIGLLTAGARALLGPGRSGGEPRASASTPTSVPASVSGLHLAFAAETLDEAALNVSAVMREVGAALGVPDQPLRIGVELGAAVLAFRHLQGREAYEAHGAWIQQRRPPLGPGVASRFRAAAAVTDEEVAAATVVRAEVCVAVSAATAGGTVLVLPGAAGPAPEPYQDPVEHELHRTRTLRLTCLAGLAGTPVVVAPLAQLLGYPLGIAFLGAPGTDMALLEFVAELTARMAAVHPGAGLDQRGRRIVSSPDGVPMPSEGS